MTNKSIEVEATLRLALEGAANYIDVLGGDSKKYRQLLAQPEQRSVSEHLEPVAFVVKQYVGTGRPSIKGNGFDGLEIGYNREEADEFIAWVNFYITPYVAICGSTTAPRPQRPSRSDIKPLSDEELRVIENKINPNMRWQSSDEEGITLYPIEYYELVRAIEAAHGIKE